MIKEEFINTYCRVCGSQLCSGPYDELTEGCEHYQREFVRKYNKEFITCKVCNGSGADPNGNQCKTCCGFGTVIIYEEQEND